MRDAITTVAPSAAKAPMLAQTTPFRRPIPAEKVPEMALIGTPERIRERIASYEQAGAQEILLYMPDAKDLRSVRLFAQTCFSR